ncbi:MAG: hypothetical protein MI867_07590 [Pseudomonadales bacterium]|nr:hypothetical protein [Pseudomonadales bacterium]
MASGGSDISTSTTSVSTQTDYLETEPCIHSCPVHKTVLNPVGQLFKARETVLDVLAHLHMESNTVLVDTVLHLLRQLHDPRPPRCAKWEKGCTRGTTNPCLCAVHLSLEEDHSRAKLAFAIVEALNRAGTPVAPLKVADLCQVKPRQMLQIENTCWTKTTYVEPHKYVGLVCNMLRLPWHMNVLTAHLCILAEGTQSYCYKPELKVVACVVALTDRLRQQENCYELFPEVKLPNLCQLFGVTERSIYKWMDALPPFTLRIIGPAIESDNRGKSTFDTLANRYEIITPPRLLRQ